MTCSTSRPNGSIPPFGSQRPITPPRRTSHAREIRHCAVALLLYGELRYIYKLPKEEAPERLDAWLGWASRSRLKPFVKFARTIRKHRQGVLSAIELGLSNGRLEALTAR